MPKRVGNIRDVIVSDANLERAIQEVDRHHRRLPDGEPNPTTIWVERTVDRRVQQLRYIIEGGFVPAPPVVSRRYDRNARKWRTINQPQQWPDLYVQHALVQAIEPVCMRGMDPYCCGSIPGRGIHYGMTAIQRWMRNDPVGTRYCLSADIFHCYDTMLPDVVMSRFRHLVKDWFALDLIDRIVRDGVKVGFYTSQWLANTVLQPLDVLVREHAGCRHYVRYLDNFTVFGSNKRELHRLRLQMERWLNAHGMRLKGDWQVFPTAARLPDAMGYRYGRGYTIPRKRTFLKDKRAVAAYRRRRDAGRPITRHRALGLLSRYGQLKHCSNRNLYARLNRGERIQSELKDVVRRTQPGRAHRPPREGRPRRGRHRTASAST